MKSPKKNTEKYIRFAIKKYFALRTYFQGDFILIICCLRVQLPNSGVSQLYSLRRLTKVCLGGNSKAVTLSPNLGYHESLTCHIFSVIDFPARQMTVDGPQQISCSKREAQGQVLLQSNVTMYGKICN